MPRFGDYTISLAGSLPAEERCGLGSVYGDLLRHPEAIRFAVIAFDVQHIKVPTDPGDGKEPTVRIKRWEVAVEPGDVQAVLELLDAINGRREGSDAEQHTLATTAELETAEAEAAQRERDEADAAASGQGGGDPGWPADHPGSQAGRPAGDQ